MALSMSHLDNEQVSLSLYRATPDRSENVEVACTTQAHRTLNLAESLTEGYQPPEEWVDGVVSANAIKKCSGEGETENWGQEWIIACILCSLMIGWIVFQMVATRHASWEAITITAGTPSRWWDGDTIVEANYQPNRMYNRNIDARREAVGDNLKLKLQQAFFRNIAGGAYR